MGDRRDGPRARGLDTVTVSAAVAARGNERFGPERAREGAALVDRFFRGGETNADPVDEPYFPDPGIVYLADMEMFASLRLATDKESRRDGVVARLEIASCPLAGVENSFAAARLGFIPCSSALLAGTAASAPADDLSSSGESARAIIDGSLAAGLGFVVDTPMPPADFLAAAHTALGSRSQGASSPRLADLSKEASHIAASTPDSVPARKDARSTLSR